MESSAKTTGTGNHNRMPLRETVDSDARTCGSPQFNAVFGNLSCWSDIVARDVMGVTLHRSVTSDVVDLITKLGGPARLDLDSTYTKLLDFDPNEPGRQDSNLDAYAWRTNIQVRVGLLVPPGTGNKPQQWTTDYAGSYLENDWANWTVETKAWVRTSW